VCVVMLTVPADDDCGASSSELLSTTSEESAMTPSNSIEYPHDDDDDEALKIVDIPEEKFTDCEMKPSFDHDDNIKSTMDVNGNDGAHPVGSGCNRRRIYTGARFTSFAEFDEAFDEWKRKCFHPFRVRFLHFCTKINKKNCNLFAGRQLRNIASARRINQRFVQISLHCLSLRTLRQSTHAR